MSIYRVQCVTTDPYQTDPTYRIVGIGTSGGDFTSDQAIRYIESRIHSFYVDSGYRRTDVEVRVRNGHKYLATKADGFEPNNLLSLPACPRR
jgi:hypothetical protein